MKKATIYSLKKEKSDFEQVKITSSGQSAEYIRQFYFDDLVIYESFFLCLLNQSNTIIGYVKISQGGITGTVVDPIIVAKYAIESLAKAVILCHNHPSGNLQPSEADKTITQKIKTGLSFFDVRVLDHIILTENDYYSFIDNGIL